MKLKPSLGAFYAIRPGNGSGLFYSAQGQHGRNFGDARVIFSRAPMPFLTLSKQCQSNEWISAFFTLEHHTIIKQHLKIVLVKECMCRKHSNYNSNRIFTLITVKYGTVTATELCNCWNKKWQQTYHLLFSGKTPSHIFLVTNGHSYVLNRIPQIHLLNKDFFSWKCIKNKF